MEGRNHPRVLTAGRGRRTTRVNSATTTKTAATTKSSASAATATATAAATTAATAAGTKKRISKGTTTIESHPSIAVPSLSAEPIRTVASPVKVLVAGGGGGNNRRSPSTSSIGSNELELISLEENSISSGGSGGRKAEHRPTKDGAPSNQQQQHHTADEYRDDAAANDEELAAMSKPPPPTAAYSSKHSDYPLSAASHPPAISSSAAPHKGGGGGGPSPDAECNDNDANPQTDLLWLAICFFGIMISFVCYGLLLEFATSSRRDGVKFHELSFLFITSSLYTLTAAAGRYVRDEKPANIPPVRFAILGILSMGSTFCSVRSLRYVIFPIQVLAKSCKPVPIMLMGAFLGKTYPLKKYLNVLLIVIGVGLFMGGGSSHKKHHNDDNVENESSPEELPSSTRRWLIADDTEESLGSQIIGICLLFVSLCFDGATGAYEDKVMSVNSVGPFDLMYNIQLGKTILAGVSLLVFNELNHFFDMCRDMGFILVGLGLSGAMGQVFVFVTIAKFGALTCSIIGLARKVTTLVASIYFYGHSLNAVQSIGLLLAVGAMVMNFAGKKKKKKQEEEEETLKVATPHEHELEEEQRRMLEHYHDDGDDDEEETLPPYSDTPAPPQELELGTIKHNNR